MAHIYYGSDKLILTQVNRENFNTGLSRIDATYKCRTTKADELESQLYAGLRLPQYSNFIIRDNAKRIDGTDGFTTFTCVAFYGTLVTSPDALNLIPSIIGAEISKKTVHDWRAFKDEMLFIYTIDFTIISDTITRKFTVLPTDSITSLAIPNQDFKFKIISHTKEAELNKYFDFQYFENFLKPRATCLVKNINRSNYGGFDEVQVTWGLDWLA